MGDTHTRTIWLKLEISNDRPDTMPDPMDVAVGIIEGLPREWFEPQDSDDFWISDLRAATPQVVVIEDSDSAPHILASDGIEVEEFSWYMTESPTDYEVEDYEAAIARFDALPPDLQMDGFRNELIDALDEKRGDLEP